MGALAAVVVGTRPEAIKLAPVVLALREQGLVAPAVVTTGQQDRPVDEVLELFGLRPTVRLPLGPRGLAVTGRVTRTLDALDAALDPLAPSLVVVQGDTASVLAGALAGFLLGRPVVHVEAGLRTGKLASPFPEEGIRRMVSQIAALHLAPTAGAVANLLASGVASDRILLTGNPVVDALRIVGAADDPSPAGPARPRVLVTAHRRESWGEPIARIGAAVSRLARQHPAWEFVVAGHLNPDVRAALEAAVAPLPNVTLTGPLAYGAFIRLLAGASVAVTDSGGIQEEAPALGVPVVVTRDATERPEAVAAGGARLAGTDPDAIVAAVEALVGRPGGHRRRSPFGDGHAAERAAAACAWLLGLGPRPHDMPRPADHGSGDATRKDIAPCTDAPVESGADWPGSRASEPAGAR